MGTDAVSENFEETGFPAKNSKQVVLDEYLQVSSIDLSEGQTKPRIKLGGMSGINEHIKITQGRMFNSGKREDGVYECIATEKALKVSGLATGIVYKIADAFDSRAEETISIEIVGVYTVNDENDSYWCEGLDSTYYNTMFIDYDTFVDTTIKESFVSIGSLAMHYSIDYHNMDMTKLDDILEKNITHSSEYSKMGIKFDFPAREIMEDYAERATQLRLILWLIQIPVMLMIVFYLFMVSQLNVEQEKNEIAVFKSRGASSGQIMLIYAMEAIVLGVATAIIGPFLGMGMCHILGASNGFMEFVNRASLPVQLTKEAFMYSLLGVVVFFLTTMIPIIPATKTTIVQHKQSKTRKKKHPLWEKVFLDIILVGGSIGWLYYYNRTQEKLLEENITSTTATINPMMFVASTAFILGCGLFVIRVYPYIIRLLYKIGKRIWTPSAYVSLNNIGRSSTGRERFLMVFLVLTISLGLFFANTARALNRNSEERVQYEVGADATISENWESQSWQKTVTDEDGKTSETTVNNYIEPAFERFETLAGVKSAARVFTKDNVFVSGDTIEVKQRYSYGYDEFESHSDLVNQCKLMTVKPAEFAETITFMNRILPTHINDYLNALAEYPSGVVLSSSFRDNYRVRIGDVVNIRWGGNDNFEATVLAFVDYWPSINPNKLNSDGNKTDFLIMNMDYVNVQTNVEPYSVWVDLEDDIGINEFYQSLAKANIQTSGVVSAKQEIISEKNNPMLQGMNGALTLGFITIMIMCIIGFLIYWILSIKSRTLQFGILRAMGMSYREIISMIFYEQLLVSGVAIAVSFVIGGISSKLFVPLFECLFTADERVPSLVVVPDRGDYLKIYAIIAFMLLVGFGVLGRLISKIKISQALKLGED